MSTDTDHLVEAARTASAAGDWATARDAWATVVSREPTAESLAGLADVLWWLGRTEESIRHHERAYSAFQRIGDPDNGAMIAVALYLINRVSLGNLAAARGWLARAARLVAENDLGPLEGWVRLAQAHDTADPLSAERLADRARVLARRFGDTDLDLCAISQLGAALVQQGNAEAGGRLLDEAMAAALAGEGTRPHTVVYTSCVLVRSCSRTADLEHVLQWVRAADDFERRYGNRHLYTTCRTSLGAVLFAAGDWAGAERELRAALELGASAEPAVCAEAIVWLALLRLAQGRLEEAERLLEGLDEVPAHNLIRGSLALARGDVAEARRFARRRVRAMGRPDLERSGGYHRGLDWLEQGSVLELLARVGDPPEAESAVQQLAHLASATGMEQLRALWLRATGILHADVPSLEGAVSLFTRLRLPLEAGRSRMALAAVLTGDDAIAEARAALATFETLGADRDANQAAARLRELGLVAARRGPAGLGELTQREREVLNLLGEGLSNRELAERLFLSRKTVERHVRNVLFKLGLRNRAEAAAYVVRHAGQIRSTS
ncbi:MAG TPA: LuxR C-terminal-related transcriptional regulator [Nocardioides sp.]|uniref:LuxR C-terminal-related transcriptional regulator n=1 Tax=Nocardioides sp. TaxID=35761 RepID=UPI002E33F18B|nr:LuxR C-terminal-related transcriptional regulator [Nocardioides sp.]HEX5089875.1 LuxR C-terminal-related transcriptional regulator [Nocardioides sp.]